MASDLPRAPIAIAPDAERATLLRKMTLANFEARIDDALESLIALRAALPDDVCPFLCVSAMIDTLVMAGRYRDALTVPDAWSDAARERGALADPRYFTLARVNAAEALYNLGRVSEASALMRRVQAEAKGDRVALPGVLLQRAWIATLEHEPKVALALIAEIRKHDLPREYHAELRYTKAFARAALNELSDARLEAEAGFRCAVRVSSFRNGLFLLASIALQAGEIERAAAQFQAAMEHPYRAQGGAALLAYGDLLRTRGDVESACAVYTQLIERDPESAACSSARTSLIELRGHAF